jgi:hypothetical protein
MRPEALSALKESDLIIHCGDIGHPAVLDALENLAPVRAIRGNNDRGDWARQLPSCDIVEAGAHSFYVLHNLAELDLDPLAANFTAVLSGHSHKPAVKWLDRVLYLNPGSAGPRRFTLPVTVATLVLRQRHCAASIIELI